MDQLNYRQTRSAGRKVAARKRPLPRLVSDSYGDYNDFCEGALALDDQSDDFERTSVVGGNSSKFITDLKKTSGQKIVSINDSYVRSLKETPSSKRFSKTVVESPKVASGYARDAKALYGLVATAFKTKVAKAVLLTLFMFVLLFGPSIGFHSFFKSTPTHNVSPTVITVSKGQTAASLAAKLDPADPQALIAQINAQTNSSALYVGEKIVIRH